MAKMKNRVFGIMDKVVLNSMNVKRNLVTVTRNKENGGKEVIVEILLIVVGIVIAIVFRTSITAVVNSLVTAFSTKISGIMA